MKLPPATRPIGALAMTVAAAALAAPVILAGPAQAATSNAVFGPATQLEQDVASTTTSRPGTFTTLQGTGFSQVGQPATFKAVLYPANPVVGEPVATGTVSFFDGARLLGTAPLDPNATTTFTTSVLTAGLHSITATYNGDTVYTGSTSDPLTQQVAAPYVFTNPARFSGVVGVPLAFTVRTTGYPPPVLRATGSLDGLTLTDHGDGTATLAGTPAAAGTFPITLSAGSLVNPVSYQTVTLAVAAKPQPICPGALGHRPPARVGHHYHLDLRAREGINACVWTVVRGWLPPGLWLQRDGTIAGTPHRSGRWTFTVAITAASHPQVRVIKSFALTVAGR